VISIASLTGHAAIALGPYSAALNVNGAAVDARVAEQLHTSGFVRLADARVHARRAPPFAHVRLVAHAQAWGDPVEVSCVRREDFKACAARSTSHDVLQCPINEGGSIRTMRGHQFPAAFMSVVSKFAESSVPYVHIDMAGRTASGGRDMQSGTIAGAPLAALFGVFVLPRLS
jgi:leucyl aminopeptidase